MEEKVRACSTSDRGLVAEYNGIEQERYWRECRLVILRYLRKYKVKVDAYDDVVQEVLFRLWANRENFRGEACLRVYVIGILRNVLFEQLKAKRRLAIMLTRQREQLKESSGSIPTPEDLHAIGEILHILQEAICALTPAQQFVVASVFTDCMPRSQAAAKAGSTVEASRSRFRRARQALADKLRHIERPIPNVAPWEVESFFLKK